jgi:peptide alpha-N-acetyltransferase
MVFQEAGNTEQALEHLDTYQHQICDKVTLLETRAKYYMQIQKTTDSEESKTLQTKAADIYKGLIKRNPENHAYYTQLAESMDVKTEESQLAMYAEYRQMFPKAQAPQRLPMNFAHGKWVQLCIYGMC